LAGLTESNEEQLTKIATEEWPTALAAAATDVASGANTEFCGK